MDDYSFLKGNQKDDEARSLLKGKEGHSPEEAKELLQKLRKFSGFIEDVIFDFNSTEILGCHHLFEARI
jgi:hypothetical protein